MSGNKSLNYTIPRKSLYLEYIYIYIDYREMLVIVFRTGIVKCNCLPICIFMETHYKHVLIILIIEILYHIFKTASFKIQDGNWQQY